MQLLYVLHYEVKLTDKKIIVKSGARTQDVQHDSGPEATFEPTEPQAQSSSGNLN